MLLHLPTSYEGGGPTQFNDYSSAKDALSGMKCAIMRLWPQGSQNNALRCVCVGLVKGMWLLVGACDARARALIQRISECVE